MTDEQLLRYSRHILLTEIGIEGQERISGSHALVVGAGGLGSPVALYLGSAGVGHITIEKNEIMQQKVISAIDAAVFSRAMEGSVAQGRSQDAIAARQNTVGTAAARN